MMHKPAHVHVSAIRANAHNAHIPLRYVHLCSTSSDLVHLTPGEKTARGKNEKTDDAHARTHARLVGLTIHARDSLSAASRIRDALAFRGATNEFVIRGSSNACNRDKHLAAPSNDSLTAVGSCSVLGAA
jgi:hypothetical protein